MRLSNYEILSIKQVFKQFFQEGEIYLFGSRVNDDLKGGDIDLYISNHNVTNILERKLKFLVELKKKIGDQKIDLIISKDINRVIEQEAINKGVKLV
jgi:predicted nucleotidyltransferase